MNCDEVATERYIEKYLLGELDEAETEALEEHYFECDDCSGTIKDASALRSELAKDRWAATPRPAPARSGWTWAWVVAASAVVVIVGASLWLRAPEPTAPAERLRGVERASIVVLAPIGDVPAPTELDWKIVPGAIAYELRLHARSGALIWEESTEEPPAGLPGLRNRLRRYRHAGRQPRLRKGQPPRPHLHHAQAP